MLTELDKVEVQITQAMVDQANANPDPKCTKPGTGRLRELGNMVVAGHLRLNADEYKLARAAGALVGAGLVITDNEGQRIGISPAVTTVSDDIVMTKHMLAPGGQTHCHTDLVAHYTVAVHVLGRVDQATQQIGAVQKVILAGWAYGTELRRFVQKNGTAPFTAMQASLIVAPCDILRPLSVLERKLIYSKLAI